ncbi:MAG: MarR family transcriptional regulator [Verrucomicrobiae bacterium]|nr:MarR family transcriptional regulator [Verrucomicrobiae bacterium]
MGRHATDSPPAGNPGDRRLPPLLRRAWYGLNQAFRRRIAHLEITPDQYTALRNLFEAGPRGLTQSELTEQMSSDPNTIASLVERMESAGLLRRETDPADRRARRLRIALTGRRRFQLALTVAHELQDEVLESLDAEERQHFLAILDKLSDACRRAAERT